MKTIFLVCVLVVVTTCWVKFSHTGKKRKSRVVFSSALRLLPFNPSREKDPRKEDLLMGQKVSRQGTVTFSVSEAAAEAKVAAVVPMGRIFAV
jgi:hypothetical protein